MSRMDFLNIFNFFCILETRTVGTAVGWIVGLLVGTAVGWIVGLLVGTAVGWIVDMAMEVIIGVLVEVEVLAG